MYNEEPLFYPVYTCMFSIKPNTEMVLFQYFSGIGCICVVQPYFCCCCLCVGLFFSAHVQRTEFNVHSYLHCAPMCLWRRQLRGAMGAVSTLSVRIHQCLFTSADEKLVQVLLWATWICAVLCKSWRRRRRNIHNKIPERSIITRLCLDTFVRLEESWRMQYVHNLTRGEGDASPEFMLCVVCLLLLCI